MSESYYIAYVVCGRYTQNDKVGITKETHTC